jgi:peptide/nickel transport system permease protein
MIAGASAVPATVRDSGDAALAIAGPPAGAPWSAVWRRFRRDRGAVVGLAVVLAVIAAAVFAPVLAPFPPNTPLDLIALKSRPPSWTHPFGTDPVSRDVLSRVLYASRVSLSVAVLSTVMATTVGTLYGAISGYAGGALDDLMMRVTDACLSMPRLLLLLVVVSLWNRLSLGALILTLGLTGWFGMSRIVRAEVLALRDREWVVAARALGASTSRILFRHALPNVASPIIVGAALGIGQVILLEAGLSFLGLGVQPPYASWGNIMLDGADEIRALWWLSIFPGVAIVTTVMAINAVADGLRDAASAASGL